MAEIPTEPGWYSDPEGVQKHQAYWDGTKWTGAIRPARNKSQRWLWVLGFVVFLGVAVWVVSDRIEQRREYDSYEAALNEWVVGGSEAVAETLKDEGLTVTAEVPLTRESCTAGRPFFQTSTMPVPGHRYVYGSDWAMADPIPLTELVSSLGPALTSEGFAETSSHSGSNSLVHAEIARLDGRIDAPQTAVAAYLDDFDIEWDSESWVAFENMDRPYSTRQGMAALLEHA